MKAITLQVPAGSVGIVQAARLLNTDHIPVEYCLSGKGKPADADFEPAIGKDGAQIQLSKTRPHAVLNLPGWYRFPCDGEYVIRSVAVEANIGRGDML